MPPYNGLAEPAMAPWEIVSMAKAGAQLGFGLVKNAPTLFKFGSEVVKRGPQLLKGAGDQLKQFGIFSRTANNRVLQLESPRDFLLRNSKNSNLQKEFNELHRLRGNPTGNGGTADALRHELQTNELLSKKGHFQKAFERRDKLVELYKNGGLSESEKAVTKWEAIDLQNSLSAPRKFLKPLQWDNAGGIPNAVKYQKTKTEFK